MYSWWLLIRLCGGGEWLYVGVMSFVCMYCPLETFMYSSWVMSRNGGSLCLRFLCGCMFVGCWREECGGVCNLKTECYLIELTGNNFVDVTLLLY